MVIVGEQVDVVGEVVVEYFDVVFVYVVVEVQGEVGGDCFFFVCVGIVYFVGVGGGVWIVGVQFVEGWGVFGVVEGGGQ